jgi:hypothetical protein
VFVSPMRACWIWLGSVAREESRAKKTAVNKRLSPPCLFTGDGGLKMSNNAAERAIRPIALGGKSYFLLVSTPEDGVRHFHPHRDRQNSTMSNGVLRVPLRARRPKMLMVAESLGHFARQVPHTRSRLGGSCAQVNLRPGRAARRSSPPPGANLMNFGPDSQAFVKRSAHQPSLPERGSRLVLIAFRARFLGAGRLLARMRILPGGDRLRLRG